MRISTKGRYALRLMIDLAEHYDGSFIALRDVAQRQEISKKYLEQIIPVLNRNDVLQTSRGVQGGYRLSRAPDQYTVGEILRLSEGSISPVACVEEGTVQCPRSGGCVALPIWQGLDRVIREYLDAITLQDILDREQDSGTYVI